ncbi:MAG: Hpt domain-containing protein, partial [Burkholderiales bacterium]|nr:Hpt domain-containing protein [Burkholderiales bacterium]
GAATAPGADAAAPDSALPTLDLTVLRQLVGGDETAVRELVDAFAESSPAQVAALAAALGAGDRAQVASLAHRLKSAARSVGALALGDLCALIEADAREPRARALQHWAGSLESAFDAVLDHMRTRQGV